MPTDSHQSERRKHQRYEVPHLAIAVPKRPTAQVARIVNISKGGLAVRYLDQEDWLGHARAIDILVNSNFFMTNIPITNINDFKVKNQVSFSIVSERQCCLEFGPLSSEQELQLKEFILRYAAGNI
ncbi:MAG: PilZ domain-containing protein [Desulfobulbales bacterium]|nr:PilZ domain-containing protein [Desulfobulbales bacterium]